MIASNSALNGQVASSLCSLVLLTAVVRIDYSSQIPTRPPKGFIVSSVGYYTGDDRNDFEKNMEQLFLV